MTGLRFRAANLDFNLGHDGDYLAHLCEDSDILLVQEAKNLDLAKLVPDTHHALQDTSSKARAGCGIIYRTETVKHHVFRLHMGARPVIFGRPVKMMTRWFASARLEAIKGGEHYFAIAAHEPPARFKPLQPGYTDRLREVIKDEEHVVIGADANRRFIDFAHALGLAPISSGIVGLAHSRDLRQAGHSRVDPYGKRHHETDHPSIRAILAPHATKETAR